MRRNPYPSDVSDDEWAFLAPYLSLMREDAPQRAYPIREVFNALRYFARGGIAWRMRPHDLPPWHAVHQQALRWIRAGVFDDIVHDLRCLLRSSLLRRPLEPGLHAPVGVMYQAGAGLTRGERLSERRDR